MPFSIRPYRRFPVHCAVTYKAGPFLKLRLAYCLGFWSAHTGVMKRLIVITLLFLSSAPGQAEWVPVAGNDQVGMAVAQLSPIPVLDRKPAAVVPVPKTESWWTTRHEQIVARIRQGEVDLLMIGDSITQGWEDNGRRIWTSYYGGRRAVNLGFSADRTEHVLWRLDHGEIEEIAPKLVVVMYEENQVFRQIFLDGRKPAEGAVPRWMGYSTGRWEGDQLVVETVGFVDQGWLDGMGHPHTANMHVTERFRRRDAGHLEIQITIDDPGAYTAPFTYTVKATLVPEDDLLEYFCTENEKDSQHYR